MASQHIYVAGNTADITSSSTVTLLQLVTPATRLAWVKELWVSGKSVTSTDVPVIVDLIRQTSAGTSGGTITPQAVVQAHPASLCTVNTSYSAEPTSSGISVAGPWYLTPIGGLFVLQTPLGDEVELSASSRIGLRIVSPAQSVSIRGGLKWGE